MHKHILIPMMATVFTGCALGPDYKAPDTVTEADFGRAGSGRFSSEGPESRWWSHFNDPALDTLVSRAAGNNRDIRLAAARLNTAKSLRRGVQWEFAPQGGASGGYQRSQHAVGGSGSGSRINDIWTSGLDASWEIDLFGRVRRSLEAADAELGAAEADLRDVQVSLLAEVAANYFGLQGARDVGDLLREQKVLLERSLESTRQRVAAGRGSALDVARAESLLKETESAIPLWERARAEHLHRLAVLLGEQPGSFVEPEQQARKAHSIQRIGIGRPADLLRRRPDIQAAERQLAAATARVGVRTAEMFPEISVSGFIRLIGTGGVDFGSSAGKAWSVGPNVSWGVLDLGRLNAVRQASEFEAEATLAHYEQTVLRAFEDVENALVRYRAAEERLHSLAERQTAAGNALKIAISQYEAGAIDSLEATDAERDALVAARESAMAAIEHRLAVVAVYKSLGGGW